MKLCSFTGFSFYTVRWHTLSAQFSPPLSHYQITNSCGETHYIYGKPHYLVTVLAKKNDKFFLLIKQFLFMSIEIWDTVTEIKLKLLTRSQIRQIKSHA